jgi:hypothetical protein
MQKDGDNKDKWNANNNGVYDKKVEKEEVEIHGPGKGVMNWFKVSRFSPWGCEKQVGGSKSFLFSYRVDHCNSKTIMLT